MARMPGAGSLRAAAERRVRLRRGGRAEPVAPAPPAPDASEDHLLLHAPTAACHAPDFQLHFLPNGDVKPCCMTVESLGNVATSTIRELWEGAARRALTQRLHAHEFPSACVDCERNVAQDGRTESLPGTFDEILWEYVERGWLDDVWPVRFEFNLSNACNLRCIHCNGELSSAIRVREGRPALPRSYGPEFFEQLREFIPHLRTAGFAGGEPFLESMNFQVFDLVRELNPELLCTANTNGTQWSPRIEAALSDLDLNPIISMDGARRETFERARVGASFDRVVENVARMADTVERRGGWIGIHFCLMRHNWEDLPDILRLAEDHGARVWVGVVRSPEAHSLLQLDRSELEGVLRGLESQSTALEPVLSPTNLRVWHHQLERVGSWAGARGAAPQANG